MSTTAPNGATSPAAIDDPVYLATDTIGDAWSWLILEQAVLYGTTRFSVFRTRLGLARKTLVARLDQLVAGGLLQRDGAPYRLTPCGADTFMTLAAAIRWGARWSDADDALPTRLQHRAHGHEFLPALQCSACRQTLRPWDVAIDVMSRTSADLIGSERHRSPRLDLLDRTGRSPLATTLLIAGDRWSSLVMRECFLGTRRFDVFQRHLGIAPNVLAQRLHRLTQLGILGRRSYQARPVRHEYVLTKKGLDYYPIPLSMLTWALQWLPGAKGGIVLRHRSCDQQFTAILACEQCGEPATRDDVLIEPAPPSK